jgi:integrase
MDAWGWEQLEPWLDTRRELPVGPLLCVINGARADGTGLPSRHVPSCGAPPPAGVRRRFAPHQLRRAHAVEMAREGVPLIVIQRQLGHSNLGITSVYLQGIDSGEIRRMRKPVRTKDLPAYAPRAAQYASASASITARRV